MTKLMRRSAGRPAPSRPFRSVNATVGLALGIGLGLVTSCDAPDRGDHTSATEDEGSLAVALGGSTATTTTGFQIDVVTAGGASAVSRFVTATPTTNAFFVLAPGAYVVTATALDAPGQPTTGCAPASAPATIAKGKTSALLLVARCAAAGPGGLDATVRTNRAPEITSLAFDPATTVAPCAPLGITVAAADADGDALTYAVRVTAAPAGAQFKVEAGPAGSAHATFSASTAGAYALDVSACDALGCTTLATAVQVDGVPAGGGACVVSCDDQNPCTTDTRAADGTCGHAGVADGSLCTGGNLRVKLLGINDFHGQIEAGKMVSGRPVGGAAVLASYLKAAQAGIEDQTVIVHAGDQVGASPPASALLQDEPSIMFLDLLANGSCGYLDKMNAACNIVGTFGNHEFDEGKVEALRLLGGGNFNTGPFLEDPYQGARFPYVSANVIDEISGQPLMAPLVVKRVKGVPIAFIGAVLKQTPTIVTPAGVAGLQFLDEADAINSYLPGLKAMGVRSIVVTIHQGGFQTSYNGPTRPTAALTSGPEILDIINRLDDEVDVVVSGHSHAFANALVPNAHGKPILLTQAFSASTAFDDIDLLIDPVTKDVVSKVASIVTTFADAGPGLIPDAAVASMVVAPAVARVTPLTSRVVGVATTPFTRTETAAGESTMGDLIADAQRAAMGTELAFMNPGGIRNDLDAGDITWGELFSIQPFGNSLVRMSLTGAQVVQVLEQQFPGGFGQTVQRIMKISGFSYTWDPSKPAGSKVVQVRLPGGAPIDPAGVYSITCNNFMAGGGDGFTTFVSGTMQVGGPIDLDALIEYVEDHTPVTAALDGRIANP